MGVLKPRWHGNGFIQVYLNPVTRLHIWSPEFPATRVVNAQIHDHRFTFTSKILMGELHNVVYACTPYEKGEHMLSEVYCGGYDKTKEPKPLHRIVMQRIEPEVYKPGDVYEFGGSGNFHETKCHGLTVTVMTKTAVDDTVWANVVSRYPEEPDHAFDPDKTPSEEDMLEEVARVTALLW